MTVTDPAALAIYGGNPAATQANFTPATNYNSATAAQGGYYFQDPNTPGAYTQFIPGTTPLPSGTQLYTFGPSTSPSGISPGAATTPTSGATVPGTGTSPTTGATAASDTTTIADANQTITSALASLGLGAMAGWASSVISTLAGQGVTEGDIVSTIESELNNPTDPSTGQVNQAALDAFNAAMPGYNDRIAKTGNNGSPGSDPIQALANYINYQTQIQQFATQAGLVSGTISAQVGGNLWANNVSSSEVSQRITDATVAASSAPQQVQDYLSQNFLN